MKRRLFCFFALLFSCVMLSYTTVVYATESGRETSDFFQLVLYVEDSLNDSQNKVDLSGIKVDVYSSKMTNFDKNLNLSEFTHDYAFSVYTDKGGKIRFLRPSEEMLILVDVSTLPKNTGIEISTRFYRGDITQDKLAISKVDRVEIEKIENSEDDYYVNAYNKDGTRINVEYTLSEKSSVSSENERVICMEASVGDITVACEYTIPLCRGQELEIQQVECVEGLLKQERETTTPYFTPEDFNQNKRFGHFLICYNYSSNITPPFITSLASALQAANTSLVGGLALNRPTSNEQGTPEYYIFILDHELLSEASAYCESFVTSSENRISYIVFQNITDLSVEATLFQKGTAAHEYMHAITHTYRRNSEIPLWFKESWANWAAVRVQGINSRNVSDVNKFLNNTHKSFKTDEYIYGKFLLPLYIGQNYGGDVTVANVIKNLATTANVELAISNALPSGVTFQSIFPDFMGYNYAPKYFYTTYANGWNNCPRISASYSLNGYPNDAYIGVINSYATDYREFSTPDAMPYTLDITVRSVNTTWTLAGKLHMTTSSGVVTNWAFSPQSSLVTYSTTIGTSYLKGGMSITNKGSGSTGCFLTIERS